MSRDLLITIDYPPNTGGVARYLEQYAKENDLDILASGKGRDGRVVRKKLLWSIVPKWFPLVFWGYFYGLRYKKIVISHILPVGYVCLALGKPYTVILHGLDIINACKNEWKRYWARKILDKSEHIIVNSKATGALLEKVFKTIYRFEVKYPTALKLPKSNKDYKQKLELNNKKIILSLGRLVKRKGQEKIIRLMPDILREVPNVIFVIAGEGPYRKELEELARDVGVYDFVKFLGRISEEYLSDIYAMCDVFVLTALPSADNWEGFGMVCLEADQFDKPVVVSNIGGLPEAAEMCKSGFIVKNDDELLNILCKILSD